MQRLNSPLPASRATFSKSLLALVGGVEFWRTSFTLLALLGSLLVAKGGPTIVSSMPANGATGVPGVVPVVFMFSTNMDPSATFTYFFAGTSIVFVTPSWSADGKWMTNTPNSSFPGGTMINWMVMGQSAAGAMLEGTTTGSFTTGSGGPTIVSITPATGSTNVSLTAPVILTFSSSMNPAVTKAVFYGRLGATLSVTPTWNPESTRLTNTPTPAFTASTPVTWLVTGQDTLGRALSGTASGNFMTGTSGSPTPTLVSVAPTNNATGVPPSYPVYFVFSMAMNTNLTTVQFYEPTAPTQFLPATFAWTADRTMLSCTPTPEFPGGKVIIWSLQGQAASGGAFAGATGSFATAESASGPFSLSALLSRGEAAEQMDTGLVQPSGQEFRALAGELQGRGLAITRPSQSTSVLSRAGTVPATEFSDTDGQAFSFATNYPAGVYQFRINTAGGVSIAAIGLSDGVLPAAPRLLNWQNPLHVILGQPLALEWTWDSGGAPVSYLRLRIEQGGKVVFASPLPDSAGALNAGSNGIVVPAGVFTTAEPAEVSLSAFSFIGLDTNSIPGLTLHAARHRTTTFALRVVDGGTPPPTLLSTNLAGFAVAEPFLFMLRATNGVRPLRFTLLAGALPPGLNLDPEGALGGNGSGAGTFVATVRLTDLLGRSTTQSLRIVTARLPLFTTPRFENIGGGAGSTIQFDLVGSAGVDCVIERSTNLLSWSPHLTTNSPLDRLTLRVPLSGAASYFRARGGEGASVRTPNPRTVVPILNPNASAAAEMGWLGGSLSLTNASGCVFSLIVPPGALTRPEMVTMTEIAQVQGLPLSGGLRAAVDLKPEGLMFHTPARLDITAPAALDPRTLIGFGALADGSQFALRPAFVTNRTASLFVRHFSSAGVGDGTGGDAQSQAQDHPTDDPGSSAEQDAAAAMHGCRADPSCDINSDEMKAKLSEIYVRMADQVILPALKAASGGASDDALDQALSKWLDWARQVATLGVGSGIDGDNQTGSLADRMRRAVALASKGIANGMTRACDQCVQHDLQRMGRVFRLAKMGTLLGFGSDSQYWSCVKRCLVYKLKIEAEITATTTTGTLRTKTKSEPKLTPEDETGEAFTGSGSWNMEEVEPIESKCSSTVAPASGSARIPTMLVDLFKERTVTLPIVGQFVVYEYDPTLWVALGAELSGTPTENWAQHCPKEDPPPVDRIFGPAFLTLHANESGSDRTGSQVLWIRNFDKGSGETLFTKDYEREQGTSKGPVKEKTHIELRHTPK